MHFGNITAILHVINAIRDNDESAVKISSTSSTPNNEKYLKPDVSLCSSESG